MRSILLVAAALLCAGCISDDGSTVRPADGVIPDDGLSEVVSPDGAIGFAGKVWVCDEGFCIDANVTNEGSDAVHVSNICVPPFSESMKHDGQDVNHREPMFHCQAFGTEPFEPGETRRFESTWDGRVWDEGYSDAPAGEYTWQITFRYWSESGGGEPNDLVLPFTVVVQ